MRLAIMLDIEDEKAAADDRDAAASLPDRETLRGTDRYHEYMKRVAFRLIAHGRVLVVCEPAEAAKLELETEPQVMRRRD